MSIVRVETYFNGKETAMLRSDAMASTTNMLTLIRKPMDPPYNLPGQRVNTVKPRYTVYLEGKAKIHGKLNRTVNQIPFCAFTGQLLVFQGKEL